MGPKNDQTNFCENLARTKSLSDSQRQASFQYKAARFLDSMQLIKRQYFIQVCC